MQKRAGFTLIELSLVLAVLSLMLAGIMSIVSQNMRRSRAADLQVKMDTIEASLLHFRQINNRLPCPADGTIALNAANFGVEGVVNNVVGTTCVGASAYVTGNRTVQGAIVPTA